MSSTLNVRASKFALRHLFLAEPVDNYMVASLSAAQLGWEFCSYDECEPPHETRGCRLHSNAMVLGLSKMIAVGSVLAELSNRGVLFVRLSPVGVLEPTTWTTIPGWVDQRPGLVVWAREQVVRQGIRADVERWESRV